MSLKVIDTLWFSGMHCVGLVACENEMGERKFYIGKGEGYNEEFDANYIKDHGLKCNKETFMKFFDKNAKPEEKSETKKQGKKA